VWLHAPYHGGHIYSDIVYVYQTRQCLGSPPHPGQYVVIEKDCALTVPYLKSFIEYPVIAAMFLFGNAVIGGMVAGNLLTNYYLFSALFLSIPTLLAVRELMRLIEIDLPERVRKSIGKKHRAMKEAQEAAAEADRLAESQYNQAMMAERRANELEDQLKKAKPPEAPKPELKAPDENDPQWLENGQFNWRKFTAAQADYAAKTAVAEYEKEQETKRSTAERTANEARIAASADEARKAHPDFDAVMEAAKGTAADIVPQFVLNYIYESDQSAQIAYYLAKNPEETQKIAKMKPILGLAELGKLADKLTAKPDIKPNGEIAPAVVPERGGAPPPITPIATNASGTVNTDPSRMSFRELREFEAARRKKR
jgi:hypothetical protein